MQDPQLGIFCGLNFFGNNALAKLLGRYAYSGLGRWIIFTAMVDDTIFNPLFHLDGMTVLKAALKKLRLVNLLCVQKWELKQKCVFNFKWSLSVGFPHT
jgi:hypothetical protein